MAVSSDVATIQPLHYHSLQANLSHKIQL